MEKGLGQEHTFPRISLGAAAIALSILALLGLSGAREGILESIYPWQLTKLRKLLLTSAIWLALVSGVLFADHLLGRRDAQSAAFSLPKADLVPAIIVLLFIAAYVGAYGWLATQRHYRFNSTGYDLAIKEQVIWNTVQGRFFASSPEVDNAFEDHFQPIMLALVPLYAVFPSTELLLWGQTAVLALGAIPLYHLARRRLRVPWLALAPTSAYLLYPALGFVNRFDFHPEALAIPAFIAAFAAFDRDDLTAASLWLIVPLLSKENLGFSVAFFGLYAALFRKRIRFGLIWAVVGVTVSVGTMFWLIPTLRRGPSDTLARYSWLGDTPKQIVWTLIAHPLRVWNGMVDPNRALYLLQLLTTTGFLALMGLPELMMVIPGLTVNLLAHHHCQASIYCQYTVPITPFIFIAAVIGLQRIIHLLEHRWAAYVLGFAVVSLSVLALAIDNPFAEDQTLPDPLAKLPNAEAVRRALAVVPPGASVVTTNAYAPHLAQREALYLIGIPAQRDPPPDPQVVFVNLYDQRFMLCDQYQAYFKQLDIDHYGLIFRDSGVVVAQRDGGSNEGFRDFVLNWTDCAG
jgi:uncharacterized membrane protein